MAGYGCCDSRSHLPPPNEKTLDETLLRAEYTRSSALCEAKRLTERESAVGAATTHTPGLRARMSRANLLPLAAAVKADDGAHFARPKLS
jgi:hypothetical protein